MFFEYSSSICFLFLSLSVSIMLTTVDFSGPYTGPSSWKRTGVSFLQVGKKESNLTVVNTTTTSVFLRWKLGRKSLKEEPHSLEIHYRPLIRIASPPTLVWNGSMGFFEAKRGHGIHDTYSASIAGTKTYSLYNSNGNINEILIDVNGLQHAGVNYEFSVKRYFTGDDCPDCFETAKVAVRTQPVIPSDAPKTGAGCFHVYNVYANNRRVKIYWQGVSGKYEVTVFEDDGPLPIYSEVGDMESGYLWSVISLKSHRFVFKSINDAGISKAYSVVNIPAQSDLLPTPATRAFYNTEKGTYVLNWEKPRDSRVDNYTLFWVDTIDRQACLRISDFVYLPGNQTYFEVKGEDYVGFALSVNWKMFSSGLKNALRV